ncbi:MAG: hypothetical protein L6Q29_03465 [Candidatus Pacebacteria bacterium]|nr:hypothetical protein [Candidatus Paceibacterota bacterium]NUQ57515.1 hypothetical protein [Candidatus Paceibacter sp.]
MAIKQPTQRQIKIYNSFELYTFEKELNKYKISDLQGKKYLTVGGEFAYLQDNGIIQSKSKIIPEMKTLSDLPEYRIAHSKISEYTEYLNKRKQYDAWKFKQRFAIEKKLEDWDEVAKSMPEISSCERGDEITTEDIDKAFDNL